MHILAVNKEHIEIVVETPLNAAAIQLKSIQHHG